MMKFLLHVICSCIFIHCMLSFFFFLVPHVSAVFYVSLLSLSLSFSFLLMVPKKSDPSKNPIRRRGSSSSSSAPFPLDYVWFHDEKASNDFFENFSNRVIHSKRQVILSDFPDTPLPGVFSSQGWAFLCEKPSRYPNMFIQEFYSDIHVIDTFMPRFTTVFRGTHIVVTLELIFEVLRIPRADLPDYPSHERLSSISRDELALLFCEKAILWGGSLNFSTTEFAKGLRILNMVMTFVLTSQSHYNTITEPHACFLFLSWKIFL